MNKLNNPKICTTYYDYKVTNDGNFISQSGHQVSWNKDHIHIKLNYNGAIHDINGLNLLYELYYGKKVSKKYYVYFKNNDPNDRRKENLALKKRNYDFTKRRKFDEKEVKEILDSYNPNCVGENNAEARQNLKKETNRLSPSYRELAKKHDCSVTVIERIIQGTYIKKDSK